MTLAFFCLLSKLNIFLLFLFFNETLHHSFLTYLGGTFYFPNRPGNTVRRSCAMKRYFSHSQLFAVYITKVLKQSAFLCRNRDPTKHKNQRQKSLATILHNWNWHIIQDKYCKCAKLHYFLADSWTRGQIHSLPDWGIYTVHKIYPFISPMERIPLMPSCSWEKFKQITQTWYKII